MSRSHIHAVASAARVYMDFTGVFDYGIDGFFDLIREDLVNKADGEPGHDYSKAGYQIDFQLKSSFNWEVDGEEVVWSIKNKAYNKLANRGSNALPAILILLCLPKDDAHWAVFEEDALVMKRCCYYTTIEGPPIPNYESTKQLRIPRANVLNPASLRAMLEANRLRLQSQF